ncbi:MAG: hypothetical protein E7325_11660 [Clostridiales bacterium]|nr:hypothetical protein [Clostridiales bacterium]
MRNIKWGGLEMHPDDVVGLLFFLMVAMVIIAALYLHHLFKVKKYRIEKEKEKEILDRIISTVNLNIDDTANNKNISACDQTKRSSGGRIRLSCQKCGSSMELDKNKPILFCPYCGAKELLTESDYVKEARINADAKEKIAEVRRQTANDIYERYVQSIKLSRTEERKTKTHNTLMNFIYIIGGFIALILMILAAAYGIGLLL